MPVKKEMAGLDLEGKDDALHALIEDENCITLRKRRSVAEILKSRDLAVEGLNAMPEHVGTLLRGSGASDYKMDEYSDLDFHIICTHLPVAESREQLHRQLGNQGYDNKDMCEWSNINGLPVTFCFVPERNQLAALDLLEQEGLENALMDFSDSTKLNKYTIPGYGWSHGKILSDPSGRLASFRDRALKFPEAYRVRTMSQWSSVWSRHSQIFLESFEDDAVTASMSLHLCIQAAVKVLLAKHRIYCDPVAFKWVTLELKHLPPEVGAKLKEPLGHLPAKPGIPLAKRFEQISEVWKLSGLRMD